ncbi:MAG: DUF2252 family protein [Pseudomonadota bacterium]
MNIVEATRDYEAWTAERLPLVPGDLRLKHRLMAAHPFPFLRATFYRWMQLWPAECSSLTRAPEVLAVGDLHIENFGSWRDSEGRLVWGINDFDETYPLPYTLDLVRLATSALLAQRDGMLSLGPRVVAAKLLEGYRMGLAAGGRPFVLAEAHGWMRGIALGSLRDPIGFWQKLSALPAAKKPVPRKLRKLLDQALPDDAAERRIVRRVAGLGSLGRPRFVLLAQWDGGMMAREGKALLPSACTWANGGGIQRCLYADILARAVRCPDPWMRPTGKWMVRRLAADSTKLRLELLPAQRDERRLIRAMGYETANIHLGSRGAIAAIRRDLDKRPADWLARAAKTMADAVTADWRDWCRHRGATTRRKART